MSSKRIGSNENDSLVLWVMHVTNPLHRIFVHVETILFVSRILLASVDDVLILNELG